VIEQPYIERAQRRRQLSRHFPVGKAGAGVATRVIMRKHDGGGIRRKGGLDNPAEWKGYGGPLAFRKVQVNHDASPVKIGNGEAFFSDGFEIGRKHCMMAMASFGNPQI
jgi:hypothetical protein